MTRLSGAIDVHIVGHDYAGRGLRLPTPGYGLTRQRRIAGLVAATALLVVVTPVLAAARTKIGLATDLSIYLLIVVVVSVVGGFWAALPAAVAGFLLLNFFFTQPLHTLTISDRENVIALLVFLIVAVVVSRVVDVSAQRLAQAGRASAEAETLSALAGSLLRGEHALDALLNRVQETFGMASVALLERDGGGRWRQLASVGPQPPTEPSAADALAEIDESSVLVAAGRVLNVADQRLLSAFAAEVAVAYRQRELVEAASAVVPLAESERVRTALLNAVSHDLRTPIASAKAAVSGLLASDVQWTEADRTELLENADGALDRLTDLVTNLLDLSRLQAGVLPVLVEPVPLDGVVQRAVDHIAGADAPIEIDVPDELPEVEGDAGLLERVIANLVQNALRYAPDSGRIRVTASAHAGWVELRVVDRGPGIPRTESETVFLPFRRRDDSGSGEGVGLGLAIARGFTEAIGGELRADETPGGGTTMVVRLKAVG